MVKNPKRFAVFDIDGTLVRWQLFHAIFDALGQSGHYAPGEYERIAASRQQWERRQEDEDFKRYEEVLVAAALSHLRSIPVELFDRAVAEAVDEHKQQVYRYTRDLIADLKRQGYLIFAISGSPQEAVSRLADHYTFDDYAAVEFPRRNGVFTGEVVSAAAFDKPALLKRLMAKHGVSPTGSIGVGDSEGDIGMLELVERPIAFNPSQKLFRTAQAKGWKIVVERKNMIYELALATGGYRLERTNA